MPTTLINASAGSGKTYRLALAYLQALLQPMPDGSRTSPEQVLATTFTRAAASEILERVLSRLALAILSETERRTLLSQVNRPELGREDLVQLLESVCRVLPQLQVGTIDGLFARIARVMGLDLAFPPAWTVADDSLADKLALEAADRTLRGPDLQLSREQWRRYSQFKPGLRVRAALVDLLEENRFHLIGADITADDAALAEPERFDLEEAARILKDLEAFDIPMTKGKPPAQNKNWIKAINDLKSLLDGERTLISILQGHSLMRLVHLEDGAYYKVAVPASLKDILGPLAKRAREDLRRLHEGRLPALAALTQRYHEYRKLVAYARGAYRFPEVESAVRMLPPHLTMDDLYFRLDGQIQHLLLDEFQDTSVSQFRFLWPIIKEVRANDRVFFAVGDPKQSIYGWRGADRKLIDRLPGWLDPKGQDPELISVHLADNRRSSPAVLRAIDRIFEHLDQADCLNPEKHRSAESESRTTARRAAATSFIAGYHSHLPVGDNRYLEGRVRLLLSDSSSTGPSDDEESSDQIGMVLEAVEKHRREDANREITILCRRRKLIPLILAGLRTRGIVASGEGGNPVTDSAAVELILSMLTWLDHPGHSLARAHVKRSGLASVFGVDEAAHDYALMRKLHKTIARRGLAAVLSDWVRHDQFCGHGTIHDQVRSEQLIELARHWDASDGGRLSAFVDQVRSKRVDNPASSRVRVMTIHGSKGLEFEAVILADLESAGGGGDGPRLVVSMTSPDEPPSILLLPNADDAELLGLQDQYARYQQDKFEEDLSVLYVALTRAKSFLDVVLPADDKPKASLSSIIRERWQNQEPGEHLVDDCPSTLPARSESQAAEVGDDPGIWKTGEDLGVSNLRTVPKRLDAVTPSGQEGEGVIDLGLVLNTENGPALASGTAVHVLFSRLEWIIDLPTQKKWIASVSHEEADREACRIAATQLYPRLTDPEDPLARIFNPNAWLEKWRSLGVTKLEVWRERRFAAIVGKELMNGSFDRVVLGLDEKGKRIRADILDFKTDRLRDDQQREERRAHYQPQLNAYVNALQILTGLPATSIQAELVWVG